MASKSPEFVEHYIHDGKFITDIWYHPDSFQYRSVISDLEPITFDTVREIRLYLKGTFNEWSKADEK